jgi:hypothetical protein
MEIRRAATVALGIGLFSVTTGLGCAPDATEQEEELSASTEAYTQVVEGPRAASTSAEVWSVENAWADTSTPRAREAGIAWPADSGLSWEEKYARWVASFERVDGRSWGKTIRITTPWGRKLDGPVLECADVGVWLRVTFASFYKLPFYLEGWKDGRVVYFGHFGVVDKSGQPAAGFPAFKSLYKDYERSWQPGSEWPSDPSLRRKHVGPDDDAAGVKIDDAPLPEGSGAGAYFDELYLNKRVGHLMVLLDAYVGSVNLADGANMFHVTPESIRPGDLLLERFAKTGIGHTLPIVAVAKPEADRFEVSTASGSMPRRQPLWQDPSGSSFYFTSNVTGGVGNASDGTPYAKLGGGLRRWRTPVLEGGRWQNIVPREDRAAYIADSDIAAIAARPERFKFLLREESPEKARDGALAVIETARRNLRARPASCSSRTSREDGFDKLYDVMSRAFNLSRQQVDAQYRKLEDYVFAELEYTKSKTCCWNTTTPQMAEIVLAFAEEEKARADAEGVCREPKVFRASDGGKYDTWKAYAASVGRAGDWRAWSEDEPCAQRDTAEDVIGARGKVAMCGSP